MIKEAPFHAANSPVGNTRLYRPLPVPQRGEIIAWLVAFILLAVCAILIWQIGRLPVSVLIFTALMIFLAAAIRFSRWMEANTFIELGAGGVRHVSPLRKRELAWSEIHELLASRAGSGWRVVVIGEKGGIRFQTATTLRGTGGDEVRTGYPKGHEIVAQILREVGFAEPQHNASGWVWQLDR